MHGSIHACITFMHACIGWPIKWRIYLRGASHYFFRFRQSKPGKLAVRIVSPIANNSQNRAIKIQEKAVSGIAPNS